MYIRKNEREAVAKGAALLDEQMPGWHNKIDLDSLQISECQHCVLGQLFPAPVTIKMWQDWGATSLEDAVARYGRDVITNHPEVYFNTEVCRSNYEAGKAILGLHDDVIAEHGFDAEMDINTRYSGLDAAWAREVRRRQKVSA